MRSGAVKRWGLRAGRPRSQGGVVVMDFGFRAHFGRDCQLTWDHAPLCGSGLPRWPYVDGRSYRLRNEDGAVKSTQHPWLGNHVTPWQRNDFRGNGSSESLTVQQPASGLESTTTCCHQLLLRHRGHTPPPLLWCRRRRLEKSVFHTRYNLGYDLTYELNGIFNSGLDWSRGGRDAMCAGSPAAPRRHSTEAWSRALHC